MSEAGLLIIFSLRIVEVFAQLLLAVAAISIAKSLSKRG
jgi:hypothetical protein